MRPALTATRLNGRIMIVSDRREVVAELEPILQETEHLCLAVSDGSEALRVLREGVIPDVVISDLGSAASLEGMEYMWRFRALNRVGRHFAIVEDGAAPVSLPKSGKGVRSEAITPLRRPFQPAEVRETIEDAIGRIDRDIRSLRGEVWREIDRLGQAVRDLRRDTVSALAATIAARDPYMHGHATRVAALCRELGAQLALEEEDLDVLETAALLHEIGKTSVPVELLLKTEPLSSEELARIRSHAAAGAKIVRQVPSLARVAPLIEQQGTDYIDLGRSFAGEEADLLLAGVLRVADAFDAMTHPRAYRGSMPQEYWERTLENGAGTTFHPAAVRVLLRVAATRGAAEIRPA